jgi:hypothetical protein
MRPESRLGEEELGQMIREGEVRSIFCERAWKFRIGIVFIFFLLSLWQKRTFIIFMLTHSFLSAPCLLPFLVRFMDPVPSSLS